jgi:hypothetical protein
MSRPARRPTRSQGRHLFSSLSIAFFALIALICLCPSSVKAEESHPEYGTVIGIGMCGGFPLELISVLIRIVFRFGNNVSKENNRSFMRFDILTSMCWHSVIRVLGTFLRDSAM